MKSGTKGKFTEFGVWPSRAVWRWAIGAMLLGWGGMTAGMADTAVLKDGTEKNVAVKSITADQVVLDQGEPLAKSAVREIRFSAHDVVAKADCLVLTDGTVLSGALHELNRETVRFRSTALGPLTLPLSRVAGLRFANAEPAQDPVVKDAAITALRLKTGTLVEGRLMTLSAQNALLRTDSGLRKVDLDKVAALFFRPVAKTASLTLRNGDRIGLPVAWQGAELIVSVDEKTKVKLTVESLKKAVFNVGS